MKKLSIILTLFFITCSAFAGKVDSLEIPSAAMNKKYKAAVVLPDTYSKSKMNYPVLYLLHGAYGHFSDWLKLTSDRQLVQKLADQYNLIIVLPEGEYFGFYLDSPVNPNSQFETYLAKEVIEKIDNSYRTIRSNKGRAITGLSMGGHGALYLSARHPDLYCAAGSMSGALDIDKITPDSEKERRTLFETILGPKQENGSLYKENSVINMIDKIKKNNLPLLIDCGVDDFLIEVNREFHRRLLYTETPHEYTERPGSHTWEYWGDALPFHALFFYNVFKSNGVTVPIGK